MTGSSGAIGLIMREKEPRNLETPLDQVDSFLIPSELFYVRSHFKAPDIDTDSYRLHIDGAVRTPFSLDYQTLRKMPSQTITATLECAGNSRVFLTPQSEGAQWELGAVGTAEWTGVPLRGLLGQAGLQEEVCEIVLEGADRGMPKEKPLPPGPISFARSLPLAKALQPEVLVAYQMNGKELLPDHGFPVRAIVPGYYGMSSVKWLTKIQAVSQAFPSYWQTSDYAYWDWVDGKPVRRGLGEIKIKCEIFRPSNYQRLAPNQVYTISGAAWTGESEVAEVAVSTDGGQTWSGAEFVDPSRRYVWRRWKFDWATPANTDRCTLLARAKDTRACTQPEKHDQSYGGYAVNHPLPIEVFIAS